MPKLSTQFVKTVTKPCRYVDGDGLCLVVAESGSRKLVLRFQVDGRRRDMGLGAYPEVTLAAAREKALDARRLTFSGDDPIAQRRAQRQAKPVPTFRELAGEVIDLEQKKSTNAKVRYQWDLLLGPTYCAAILDRRVTEITTGDIERFLRAVWHTKPETARKLHRRIRRVFEHARIRLRDDHGITPERNPADRADLKALGFEPPQKLSREPHPSLDYRELPAFMVSLRERHGAGARARGRSNF